MTRQMTPNRDGRSGVRRDMTASALERRRTRRRVGATAADLVEATVQDVYRAHFGALAGWATHLVGDPDLGHDMVTDAFVRLINRWDDVDQPRSWLYTTVGNLVKDHWRKRGRERAAYRRFQGGADPEVAVAHGPDQATVLSVRAAVE